MTLASIAHTKGVDVQSLKRKLRRKNLPVPGVDEELTPDIIGFLTQDGRKNGQSSDHTKSRPTTSKKKETAKKGLKWLEWFMEIDWKKVLPVLPLPMLGLAASWGVYHFSAHFVPPIVAIAECAGFELVYVGLAFTKSLREDLRKRVLKVSLSAVAVSVVYNSISAALYAKTEGDMSESIKIVQSLPAFLFWMGAILHGAPLAVLGFFVADLQLHKKKND